MGSPEVSYVVPAQNEAAYLPAALDAIAAQRTDRRYEVVVVDGDSDDETVAVARRRGARVCHQETGGIGAGRDLGARAADGAVLAFVDADTVVSPDHLETLLGFLRDRDLAAASSRCRVTGPRRALAIQAVINRVFPRLSRPVLPGFNLFVRADAYDDVGGFPDVPNEDTAFSRRLGRSHDTAYSRRVLAETSGRRVAADGLTGALVHYVRLDWRRVRAEPTPSQR